MRQIFCVGIVGSALSSGTGKFVKYHSAAQIRHVFLIEAGGKRRVKSTAHIGREHTTVGQTSSHIQLAVLTVKLHHLRHGIFKESGLHSRSTHGTDFFLVYQNTAGSSGGILYIQHGTHGSKCANPVVLPISQNHTAVKACFSRLTCRNHLQLGGNKVFLFYSVIFF